MGGPIDISAGLVPKQDQAQKPSIDLSGGLVEKTAQITQHMAARDPRLLRYSTGALPYVGGAVGGLLGAAAGGGPAIGGAALGAGAGEAARQLANRALGSEDVPKTSKEAAINIGKAEFLKGALTEAGGQGMGKLPGIAGRLAERYPTIAKRIEGSQIIQSAINKISRFSEEELGPAIGRLTGKSETELLNRQQAFATRVADAEAHAEELRKAIPAPALREAPTDYALGRDVRNAIYRQRVRLPKAIEAKGYTDLYRLTKEAGVAVSLQDSIATAAKLLPPEKEALSVSSSAIASPTITTARRLAGKAEEEPAMFASEEPETMSFEQAHNIVKGLNKRISSFYTSGKNVEGDPTLRALQVIRSSIEGDMTRALDAHPELQSLWGDLKSVTAERKAFSQQPVVRSMLKKTGATPAERIPRMMQQPGAETIPRRIEQGLEVGAEAQHGLDLFPTSENLETLRVRSAALADRAKTNLGKSAVNRVIREGGKEFDPSKSLDFLEGNPAIQRQMGTETYNAVKNELTRRVETSIVRKATADALETGVKDVYGKSQADFLASSYGSFLKKMSKTANPNDAMDLFISSPGSVDMAVRLTADNPEIKPVLARGMVDRIVEKASSPSVDPSANVFDAVDFAQRYAAARPSIEKLVSQDELVHLDNLTGSISKLSQKLSYKGIQGMHPAISEKMPGGLYIRGLAPNIVEAFTGKPSNQLLIRPTMIMKISRDPRLIELLGKVASNPPASNAYRLAAFSLAYALSRVADEVENK